MVEYAELLVDVAAFAPQSCCGDRVMFGGCQVVEHARRCERRLRQHLQPSFARTAPGSAPLRPSMRGWHRRPDRTVVVLQKGAPSGGALWSRDPQCKACRASRRPPEHTVRDG